MTKAKIRFLFNTAPQQSLGNITVAALTVGDFLSHS